MIAFSRRADCWLLNDAAMERILFDGRGVIHPASFPGMREKVVTVGSASKEYRMIGWRVGWVVGPARLVADAAAGQHLERGVPDRHRHGRRGHGHG